MELKGGIVNFVVDAFVVEDPRVVEDACVGASVAKLTGWGGFITSALTFPTKPLGAAAVIFSVFEEIVSIVKLKIFWDSANVRSNNVTLTFMLKLSDLTLFE